MKKVLLTLALVAVIGFTANAQEITFGGKAGLNIANFSYNFADSDAEPDTDARLSLAAGVFADIGLSDVFSVRPELLISNKGATSEFEFLGETFESTTKLTYLEIPIYGVYKMEAGSGLFLINAGPYLGFGIGGEIESDGESIDIEFASEEGDDDSVEYFRGLDFGINAGLGYELENGVGINAIYSLGLSNLTPDPQGGGDAGDADISNSVLRFSVSYRMK